MRIANVGIDRWLLCSGLTLESMGPFQSIIYGRWMSAAEKRTAADPKLKARISCVYSSTFVYFCGPWGRQPAMERTRLQPKMTERSGYAPKDLLKLYIYNQAWMCQGGKRRRCVPLVEAENPCLAVLPPIISQL
jgi:hypothetical protein